MSWQITSSLLNASYWVGHLQTNIHAYSNRSTYTHTNKQRKFNRCPELSWRWRNYMLKQQTMKAHMRASPKPLFCYGPISLVLHCASNGLMSFTSDYITIHLLCICSAISCNGNFSIYKYKGFFSSHLLWRIPITPINFDLFYHKLVVCVLLLSWSGHSCKTIFFTPLRYFSGWRVSSSWLSIILS